MRRKYLVASDRRKALTRRLAGHLCSSRHENERPKTRPRGLIRRSCPLDKGGLEEAESSPTAPILHPLNMIAYDRSQVVGALRMQSSATRSTVLQNPTAALRSDVVIKYFVCRYSFPSLPLLTGAG